MADWQPVSVEDDATPPSSARPSNSWQPVKVEPDAPQPLRQMPDFKSENDYQGWVRQHTDDQGNFQPNDSDGSTPMATVDPYGNGVGVDLRRLYKENAQKSPVSGQYELDPSTAQMEKYQTADSPILTKNSMYAAGQPAGKLGSWGTDVDGLHAYHPPGWVPPTTTQQVMDKAVDLATKGGHDIVSSVTDPDSYDPEKALDNAADFGASALKGLGGAFHGLNEDINVLGGAGAAAYDAAHSLFIGQKPGYLTSAQDAWFRNTVDPLKDQDEAFELAKNAGLPDKIAHTFGEALGTISEAILTGGESAPLDAAKTGTDAAKAAIEHGTKSMAVPATQSAIDTGQKVYEQTGDANKALKAAQVQWLVTSAGGYVPLSAGGSLPSRLAQGAVAGSISGEAGREAMNTVLPPAMQQEFDPENMTLEALSGAAMGGIGGHGEPDNTPGTRDLPTPDDMAAAGRRVSPNQGPGPGAPAALPNSNINETMYNAYHQAWSAADRGDMHIADPIVAKFKAAAGAARETADANPGDAQMEAAASQAENMANALDEKVNKTAQNRAQAQPSAPNRRAATQAKVNLIATTADDSGEIKVEPSDDGHVVTVSGRRVANFQTEAAAENAATDARQAVDDRRVDVAMRKKVGDMTPAEMQQELLTHPLTGIPNRRAYDESEKLPAQVSIDANSLKWINDEGGHAAGDHLLKAIATALHDETPNAYHFGGDEFVVQAKDHDTAQAIMDRAKQRLAGATIEMENAAGHKITLKGIGISHGISSDLGSADRALQLDKQQQESAGLRAARGEQPPGAHITAPETGLSGESDQPAENQPGTSRVLGQQTLTPAQPTPKQAKAGNYAKGEVRYHGLPIAVENVEGQYRSGKSENGKSWRNRLKGADYGYFKGTKANDGDGVDVFMGKQPDNGHAYVIDQLDKTGKKFDEHKVVVGVNSADEAKALYLRHYEKGWKGFGGVTELPLEDFKKWLKLDSHEGPLDSANVPQARTARGAGPDARHDSILQFLARHPRGLDREEAAAQGVDTADMSLPSAVVGIKRAFRKGGMSFDHAAETLHQEGYPVVDSHGQYNPNTLLDKISDELRGQPHYSSRNESNIPEASDLQSWRHARTDEELKAMPVDQLEKLHADLEQAAERAAIQAEREGESSSSDLDRIPFARGQADLFGDKVDVKNELKRVEAELDRKRNSGQDSVHTGKRDLFSKGAGEQMDLATEADNKWSPREPAELMQLSVPELREYVAGAKERGVKSEVKAGETFIAQAEEQARVEREFAEQRPVTEYGKTLLERVAAMEKELGLKEPGAENKSPNTLDISEEGQNARYEVRDRGKNRSAARNLQSKSGVHQFDIFANADLPKPAQEAARLAQSVKLVDVGQFHTGHQQVTSWRQAAHILAPIRKSPQETMAALVLDKDGLPLAVIRHSIGMTDAASVELFSAAGAVAQVPGAAQVYWAHNHPSGFIGQSPQDKNATKGLENLLKGTGIESHGMIVVAPRAKFATYYRGSFGNEDVIGPILTAARNKGVVPIKGRAIRKTGGNIGALTDLTLKAPAETIQAVKDSGVKSGVLLLNNRHAIIGVVPMEPDEMSTLRTGDTGSGAARLLRLMSEVNANRAVPFGPHNAARNVSTFMNAAGATAIDTISIHDGNYTSLASQGDRVRDETFMARGDQPAKGGHLEPHQIEGMVRDIVGKFDVQPSDIVVARSLADLKKNSEVGPSLKNADSSVQAFLHPRTGKLYFVADQIKSADQLAGLVAHEYITHYGLRAAFGNARAPEYQTILDGITKALPAEMIRRGRREFGADFDPGNRGQRNVAAEEALAYYGQRYAAGQSVPARIQRWLDRLHGMIRDWVRNVLGLPKKFDDLFVRRTLGDLEAFLRGGKDSRGGGAENQEPAFAQRQDTFYSGLAKAIDAAKREKGTGAEWEATLRNMPGVKAEEMAWTGIKDWLQGRGRVTKVEVADYIAAHQVQLGEAIHGENVNTDRVVDQIREHGYQVMEDDVTGAPYAQLVDENGIANEVADGDLPDEVRNLMARLRDGGDAAPVQYKEWATPGGENYREMLMTLPESKEDKVASERARLSAASRLKAEIDSRAAERAFVDFLPEHDQVLRANAIHWLYDATIPRGDILRDDAFTKLHAAVDRMSAALRPDARHAMQEAIDANRVLRALSQEDMNAQGLAKHGGNFRSKHWDVPNVLAHIRFDDRTGPNGEKILHVHEVQSDWHQEGRREGYRPEKEAELAKLVKRRDELEEMGRQSRKPVVFEEKEDALGADLFRGATKIYHATGPEDQEIDVMRNMTTPGWQLRVDDIGQGNFGTAEEAMDWVRNSHLFQISDLPSELKQEWAAAMNRIQELGSGGVGVPDAPFRTTWPELAMKRMLRMAAEGGYDKLSWDTGDTNAERYNMQARVDKITVQPVQPNPKMGEKNVTYHVLAYKDGHAIREENYLSPEKVSALIGKDMAQKAVSAGKTIDFTGEDLKIGGTGMRGFYDDVLPKTVNKLVKKWGSSVEPGELTTTDDAKTFEIEQAGDEYFVTRQDVPVEGLRNFKTRAAAQKWIDKNEVAETRLPAHMVDITPKMRDSVLEGQPMFARGEDIEDRRTDDDRLFGREGAGGKAYGLVRRAASSMVDNRLVGDVARILNPKDISAFSKEAAMRTSAFLGELAHQKTVAQEHLQQFSRAVNKLSPSDQLAMIHAIETGAPQPIAAMQSVADAIRKVLDTWRDNVRGLGEGHLENFIDNYFPHWWRDQKNAASVFASIQGRRTMSGPKTFLKKRTIPTTKEGIEYGLHPITTNPLVLTLLKIHEMQRFISGVTMMRAYKDAGLARFFPSSKSIDQGWKEINDPIARVSSWSEEEGGFVQRGRYAMPEDAARILNNHLSKSALADFAPAQAIRIGANLLNAMQLGFSAFHLGFTTLDAMVSKNALAMERLIAGEPLRALAALGEGVTPVGAAMNIARGMKLMNAYLNPAGATPDMKALVNALNAGGGRVHMDRYYLANEGVSPFRGVGPRSLLQDMRQALTQPQDKVWAATKAISSFPIEYAQQLWNGMREVARIYPAWQLPFELVGRTTRASSAIIMEHIVPLQKLGVWSDMAKDWLRRNPEATPEQTAAAMQSAWRSVDNRLGEMVYDNLFWNRTFKDAMHLGIRAVGWNWGTFREILGAPFELMKNISDAVRDGKAPALGHKTAYVLGLVMTQALVGATLQYLMTGKPPETLKDYMFPRTGRIMDDGTAERISLPSYIKDIYEYYHHPLATVAHKANPWISLAHDELTNTDYFGHPIYNPKDSEREEFIERMTYLAKAARPFSWSGQKQMVGAKEPGFAGAAFSAMPFVGLTPAPGLVTKPEKIAEFEHYQQEKAWKDKLRMELKQAQRSGDKAAIREAQQKINELRPAEARERAQYLREKAQAKKNAGKTSALMDQVGPLIDSSKSRAEMAQKIHAAGYPALAGLIGSLPDRLRPQVADALEKEAT